MELVVCWYNLKYNTSYEGLQKLHSRETELNRRPKDISQFIHYSPPLYQLSYREYTSHRARTIIVIVIL